MTSIMMHEMVSLCAGIGRFGQEMNIAVLALRSELSLIMLKQHP